MSKSQIVFFAMPDEQRNWLQNLLADERVWCVVQQLPPTRRFEWVNGTEFLVNLDFERKPGQGEIQLFFGHNDIVPAPVWRTTAGGEQEIDFIRSQAIQYIASAVAHDHILLSGQLGIMQNAECYTDAGIDPQPLHNWFKSVAKSFIKLKAPDANLIQHTTLGTVKEWSNDIVTPSAVTWRRSGCLLKQFKNGPVEFDIS